MQKYMRKNPSLQAQPLLRFLFKTYVNIFFPTTFLLKTKQSVGIRNFYFIPKKLMI